MKFLKDRNRNRILWKSLEIFGYLKIWPTFKIFGILGYLWTSLRKCNLRFLSPFKPQRAFTGGTTELKSFIDILLINNGTNFLLTYYYLK